MDLQFRVSIALNLPVDQDTRKPYPSHTYCKGLFVQVDSISEFVYLRKITLCPCGVKLSSKRSSGGNRAQSLGPITIGELEHRV